MEVGCCVSCAWALVNKPVNKQRNETLEAHARIRLLSCVNGSMNARRAAVSVGRLFKSFDDCWNDAIPVYSSRKLGGLGLEGEQECVADFE